MIDLGNEKTEQTALQLADAILRIWGMNHADCVKNRGGGPISVIC